MSTGSGLFETHQYGAAPKTEGIKYAGSKLKLLPQILWLAKQTGARRVLDGFSGSTRVSQAFARAGYEVVANDQAAWSEVLGKCYLQGRKKSSYADLIKHLNACKPKDGWFSALYGGEPKTVKQAIHNEMKYPWQVHNTRKLDSIREEIDRLDLDTVTKSVAITSLILALDQVDSTLGHFSSYLREWSPRSYKDMVLKIPNIIEGDVAHDVHRRDVLDVVSETQVDLTYYDPPYGSNNEKMPPSRVRYSAYYHLWTTICLNDRPEVFGKVSRRADSRDAVAGSRFEEFRKNDYGRFIAVEAIHDLLRNTPSRHMILSYSSGGRATAKELDSALRDVGEIIEVIEIDYKRNVMAGMTWTNEWLHEAQEPNREFLFLVTKHSRA